MNLYTVLVVALICITVIILTFLILLALPKSPIRSMMLELFGWGTAGVASLSVISPVDLLPEALLGPLGLADDVVALIVGVTALGLAVYQRHARKQLRQ